jgi:hypothetical protein
MVAGMLFTTPATAQSGIGRTHNARIDADALATMIGYPDELLLMGREGSIEYHVRVGKEGRVERMDFCLRRQNQESRGQHGGEIDSGGAAEL